MPLQANSNLHSPWVEQPRQPSPPMSVTTPHWPGQSVVTSAGQVPIEQLAGALRNPSMEQLVWRQLVPGNWQSELDPLQLPAHMSTPPTPLLQAAPAPRTLHVPTLLGRLQPSHALQTRLQHTLS